jgi:flagellar M-ring protein FliF
MLTGVNQSEMGTLYSNIDPAEGGQIVAKLEALNIPHFVAENGTHIEVPKDEIGRLRMILAEAGLPSGGTIGYEIFDRSEPFGMTSFVQDINSLRALEGELARSIRTLSKVANARVHLVLPKRELFAKQGQDPSASIIIKMSGAARLSNEQVDAIIHLVASAVPGLSPNNISVIDNKGTLLTKPSENNAYGVNQDTAAEIRTNYEMRIARMIENLLEKSIGAGKVRAEVTAEMDFDQFSENSEIYDPEGQVVRSTQTTQEGSSSNEANSPAVTVENNMPKQGTAGTSDANKTESNRKEEAINYEISKTVRTHIKEVGALKRISVAVMVDGVYDIVDAKKPQDTKYKPRSPEELEQLKKIVQSAVGYKKERGDIVEVFNLAFVDKDGGVVEAESLFALSHAELIHLIELGAIIIVALIVIFMVIRPTLNRLIESAEKALMEKATVGKTVLTTPTSVEMVAGSAPVPVPVQEEQNEINKQFNLGKIEGEVRASTLSTVAKIIEENPDQTINLLRTWMAEGTMKKKETV